VSTNLVMLCRDRLRLTEQALESLYANTDAAKFSLVLVDDASSDFRVRRLLQRYGEKPNATLLRIEVSSHVLARAKNIGVEWSRQTFGDGEWLYLSDNDVAFLPGWLDKLTAVAERLEPNGYRLWGGQVHPFHHHDMLAFVGQFDWLPYSMLDGPSWLMRWQTWKDMGGLRGSDAGVCKGEDVDFCQRLIASGGRIEVIKEHVVIHTGLTNSDGQDAPGRKEREAMIPKGVLAE